MPLEIYNTLSRRKEIFTPVEPGRVGLYVCGPTVYSDAHAGHAKSYIAFDVVHRWLEYLGYRVIYVQNITDVGHLTDDADEGADKLIEQGRREKKHPLEIAETYTRRYYEDMGRLNILPPDIAPRATGHIIEQIELIKKLIEKGFAYEVNGSVYFDVGKDADYGKLSGRVAEDQESSGRVEARSEKRNPRDFALWKFAERGHILRWPSPWGDGFPGWHIECSAMSMKYLGETIDIHGGGLENQFPHHECEIAQSESVTERPFVNYWMHNNMVTVDGRKMGKSLGNSSYLRDILAEYDAMTLRYTLLQSHYRSTTEFKREALLAADAGYRRLMDGYRKIAGQMGSGEPRRMTEGDREHPVVKRFELAMNDDFNTPQAIAALYDLLKESHEATGADERKSLYRIWSTLADDVLGIIPQAPESGAAAVTDSVMSLVIQWRQQARERKDFQLGDQIRKELEAVGVLLEDSKEGTNWKLR